VRQHIDGRADIARPPADKAQPPQGQPRYPETLGPSSPNQRLPTPGRSGDTGPHRRPPGGTRALRVLPRVLRRVLRPLTWGFTPPTATLGSWSPTTPALPGDTGTHRRLPLSPPGRPPPRRSHKLHPAGRYRLSPTPRPRNRESTGPPAQPRRLTGGLNRLEAAGRSDLQPGQGREAGIPGRLHQPGEAGVYRDAGCRTLLRCAMGF